MSYINVHNVSEVLKVFTSSTRAQLITSVSRRTYATEDVILIYVKPRHILILTICARGRTICPRPCTPHAAAQLQPIHALRLRHPARLVSWIFMIDRQRLALVMIMVSSI